MPIDRGGSGGIFDRDAVLKALGLGGGASVQPTPTSQWGGRTDALKARLTRPTLTPAPSESDEHDPWDFDPGSLRARLEADKVEARQRRSVARMIAKARQPLPRKPKWDKSLSFERQLGKYVVVKRRKDGRCAIYMQVPKRLRPVGWRPTINLPLQEPRTGNVKDKKEMTRVKRDAAALYESLQREWTAQLRNGLVSQHKSKEPDA